MGQYRLRLRGSRLAWQSEGSEGGRCRREPQATAIIFQALHHFHHDHSAGTVHPGINYGGSADRRARSGWTGHEFVRLGDCTAWHTLSSTRGKGRLSPLDR